MVLYNTKNVKRLSFIITTLLWITILGTYVFLQKQENQEVKPSTSITLKTAEETTQTEKQIPEKIMQNISSNIYQSYPWRIQIPKIQLNAPIYEGTQKETLRRGVGHFEDTGIWKGNICLAAHNRGYKYNYFQDIVLLEVGDEIIYQTSKGKKTYVVQTNKRIKETNLYYIQNTQENKLTLITCEKDAKEYRRCVQAVQKEV